MVAEDSAGWYDFDAKYLDDAHFAVHTDRHRDGPEDRTALSRWSMGRWFDGPFGRRGSWFYRVNHSNLFVNG
ncbi:MAG: hypothetical protein ACRDTD_26570 [Pseudonocardiaceae bacterium]